MADQANQQQNTSQNVLANAQAQAQALINAQQQQQHHQQQQQQQQQQQNAQSSTPFLALSSTGPALHIPGQLTMPTPAPEAFPAPRPTLSSGLANSPVVSTPAITKHPGFQAGHVADALGARGEKKLEMQGVGKDMREDSKGRTVSKRKIRELVESVDPEERLSDDVEDVSSSRVLGRGREADEGRSCCWRLRTSSSTRSLASGASSLSTASRIV